MRAKIIYLLAGIFIFSIFINKALCQSSCFECHAEKDLTKVTESGKEISIYVDEELFKNSVHGDFSCNDCHTDAEGDPHPETLEKVQCSNCHDDAEAAYAEGIHGQFLAQGNEFAPTCSSCHGTHNIKGSGDPESKTYPINLPATCGACHQDGGVAEGSGSSPKIAKPFEKFEKGVHGHALNEGNETAASCNSCHDSHRLLPKSDPRSPIYITNISTTCGQCHSDVTEVYSKSIHGISLKEGAFEAPTCTNCHGEHEILSPGDPKSPTYALNIAEKTCAPCHGLPKLNEKYGLLPDPVSSYVNSYHGLASSGGSKIAANCTSCHGIHNIFGEDDPNSTIHPANLQKTCGECHINVTEAFARSYIHTSPTSTEDRLAELIKIIYIYLIVIVIGGMVIHNLIIWFAYVRAKYRSLKAQKTIQRFDKPWVIQHITMFVTFTILVITGFALKFPEAGWVKILSYVGFNETIRGILHRTAAVTMLIAGIYHLFYLFFAKSWRGELSALMPDISDVRLFFANMRYHMGLSKERPKFERYGYIEKAEYWALVWGTAVMAFTGFVLWFPTAATFFFPSWIIKVSETIHYYEAWLATLAIVLYHMFFAIFHPEDYPINLTGFTGKITKEEVKERFPAWYKKLEDKENEEKFD